MKTARTTLWRYILRNVVLALFSFSAVSGLMAGSFVPRGPRKEIEDLILRFCVVATKMDTDRGTIERSRREKLPPFFAKHVKVEVEKESHEMVKIRGRFDNKRMVDKVYRERNKFRTATLSYHDLKIQFKDDKKEEAVATFMGKAVTTDWKEPVTYTANIKAKLKRTEDGWVFYEFQITDFLDEITVL